MIETIKVAQLQYILHAPFIPNVTSVVFFAYA